jgi:antitoxin component of MazEF toxin-antitoxin module
VVYFPHEIESLVERRVHGPWSFLVVYLPAALEQQLTCEHGTKLRVEAELLEHGWQGAWQPSRAGRYLKLPPELVRSAGLAPGDRVELHFRVVPEETLIVPEELASALDGATRSAWEQLTAGHRRGLCHRVANARQAATRLARVREVLDFLQARGPDPSRPRRR